jgi:hypothetical protein
MYGLLVELEIDAAQAEQAIAFLCDVAVPMIKQGRGFVSGRGCAPSTALEHGA